MVICQILFSQVYLKFCRLAYEVKSRRNAEFMSPKGIQFLFKQGICPMLVFCT